MRWRLPKPAVVAVTALLLAAAAAGIGTGVVADDGGAPLRGRVPVLARTSARPGHANRGAPRAVTAPPPPAGGHEAVTWAAAPADMGALSGLGVPVPVTGRLIPRPGAADEYRTVRDVVRTSADGWDPRVRLTNVFGTAPVTFDDVEVTVPAPRRGLPPGLRRRVTFGGRGSVTIPAGAEALSDPVPGYLPPESTLAVTLHVARGGGQVTGHPAAQQDSYLSPPGDYAQADPATAWYPVGSWFYLDGIVVTVPRQAGTVVAFGDSITDGVQSLVGADASWPDVLARRILTLPPGRRLAVADEGLASNRVTADGPGPGGGVAGLSAETRFARDVLAQPGVTIVILLEGINDIGSGVVTSAGQLIAADTRLIAQAHAAGLRILGGTLTPFQGTGYYSPAKERIREQVNAWIRDSGAFDGVVDFDRAVRDPVDPLRIAPAYDSGDHIHPDDAGYQAMADAVGLALLR